MQKEIYFAGGCFWGVEAYFQKIPGVTAATAGYANGSVPNPSYEEVCTGQTGSAEAVHLRYAPEAVSLKTLTEQFFKIIDPLSVNRQGNDRGSQYRTGIYYTDEADQSVIAGVWKEIQAQHQKPLATELLPLKAFYPAEEYHQDYLEKNPGGYCHISFESLKELSADKKPTAYHKPDDRALRSILTREQYEVTQLSATERPFSGDYWNTHEEGLYVDIVTGEPLFSSFDKFDSGCGWPSFSSPVQPFALREKEDLGHGMRRTEVRSRDGDSHLGHVFSDGPRETGGLRYCINSAALRFIPYGALEKEGYGAFQALVRPPQ